ncbi:MAG: hypothetical protein RBR84_06700 [Bacteroidales bacterium]|jgi:hypothetical protein|nr:hypothetical protein [Bacteroidales bacterium]MDD4087673.1 hypothetical protein [Bacteroidales bacterium]MDY0085590.1 hypothetical protein [Bacteroidales bacterium]
MSTILGKDEQKIKEATFTANLILFWLKANYVLTNKRITGHTPNTLLGLIPLGQAQVAQPLKTVASVTSSTKFSFIRLLIGLILVIAGFALIGSFGIILLILGAVNILNCYTATFVVTNNGGQSVGYEISILEKSKVVEFVDEINTVIADL